MPPEEVAVTVVTYEEQMRGWLAYISRAKTTQQQVEAYRRLRSHIERYRRIPLADFDEHAAGELERLRQARVRIGTMDLKIAAIALANDATPLTRNLSDFRKIPGLRVEDWTT
jgi:tRNA(fMet)-specific endonuclease VapC